MKAELKKEKKRIELMKSAYSLFVKQGFHKTTIDAITQKAKLGKGTFYLYFKDKEDIRDAIIVSKSSSIIHDAIENTVEERKNKGFYEKLIVVVDYILNIFANDLDLLKFVSKSLSDGLIKKHDESPKESEEVLNLESFVEGLLENSVNVKEPRLFIYTIIELVSSTCYTVIAFGEPVSFDEYKPYLYNCIRVLAEDQIVS